MSRKCCWGTCDLVEIKSESSVDIRSPSFPHSNEVQVVDYLIRIERPVSPEVALRFERADVEPIICSRGIDAKRQPDNRYKFNKARRSESRTCNLRDLLFDIFKCCGIARIGVNRQRRKQSMQPVRDIGTEIHSFPVIVQPRNSPNRVWKFFLDIPHISRGVSILSCSDHSNECQFLVMGWLRSRCSPGTS